MNITRKHEGKHNVVVKINVQQSILSDLADFMVSEPTLDDIAAYRVPEALDRRMHELLEKSRESGLNPEESEEIGRMMILSDLMTLAKARARLKLANQQ